MEYGLQNYTQPSLISELRQWNRQEDLFREVFKEKSLEDRDFQKMKLAEYDRIYYRYAKTATTTDERAFVRMLKFQQIKIRKAIYPRLTGRLRHFLTNYFRPVLDGKREAAMASQIGGHSYIGQQLPAKDMPEFKQNENTRQGIKPRNVYPQRQRPSHRHKRGPAI